jgi:molybdopterin synthase catalytic subunit
MPRVTILLFAILKDKIGIPRFELDLPDGSRVGDLKARIGKEYPQVQPVLATTLVSINKEFAFDEDVIPTEAEIGLFPPVSGGATPVTIVKITAELIDLNNLLEQITNASDGAACIFTGMVRGITNRGQAHQTDVLFYEAYTEMAEQKMRQVAEEIRNRWPAVDGIAIIQRVGRLEPTTPTIMIACTAAHRDTGVFEAARYGIDRLKQIVPIWKKEIGPDGEKWIEGDYNPGKASQ